MSFSIERGLFLSPWLRECPVFCYDQHVIQALVGQEELPEVKIAKVKLCLQQLKRAINPREYKNRGILCISNSRKLSSFEFDAPSAKEEKKIYMPFSSFGTVSKEYLSASSATRQENTQKLKCSCSLFCFTLTFFFCCI